MGEYVFTQSELNELKELFFNEAYEIIQTIDQEILNIEAGQERGAALKTIQRSLHTLKGNSRALGFICLNTLTHKSEDLVSSIQEASLESDHELTDLLFAINDALRLATDGYRANAEVRLDAGLIERIEGRLGTVKSAGNNGNNGNNGKPHIIVSETGTTGSMYDVHVTLASQRGGTPTGAGTVLERLSSAGEIITSEPAAGSAAFERTQELAVRIWSMLDAEHIEDLLRMPEIVRHASVDKRAPGEQNGRPEPRGPAVKDEASQTLRVDSLRVDKILNLIGELVIGRSMVGQVISELGERYKNDGLVLRLGDANAFMEKTLSELQKHVMKIRMLPIVQVFRKFPRVVRDLSQEKKKQIELAMEGEKTELDKSILDAIGEPLIHLVRNAVDHGIELPEERERAGKPRTGKITLGAFHEANQIVITVSDDGAGIDPEVLRKKAVETGIKTREEAARLSDEAAYDLIFCSGFSTAEVVTDISGRGVGMDIVRTTVESLKGRIEVQSGSGEGTTFTLRLPLTLAIIRAMLFWVDNRLFALPMAAVEKIIRIKDSDVQTIAGKQVLRFRDSVISLIPVNEPLMIRHGEGRGVRNAFIVIVRLGDTLYGFLVDRLAGQQELVIKSLDNHWGTVNCTSGASILGSGRVVLILDAAALIAKEMRREVVRGAGR
jgi:two-component system chemotaxis sensor kinase CheA